MSAVGNVIGRMELELSFQAEEEALLEQGSLAPFVTGRLLPAIDAALAAESLPGRVLRIDRLELDLGSIPYGELREEMLRRVDRKLRDALRGRAHYLLQGEGEAPSRHSPDLDPAAGGALLSHGEAELELLCFYLQHGHLPWHHDPNSPPDLEAMLGRVLERSAEDFSRLLRSSPERERAAERLVRQFSEQTVAAVADLLQSPYRFSSVNLVRTLLLSFRECGMHPELDEIRAGWETLLRLLLREQPVSNLESRLLEGIIQLVAARRGIPAAEVAARWHAWHSRRSLGDSWLDSVAFSNRWRRPQESSGQGLLPLGAATPVLPNGRLRLALAAALREGDPLPLRQDWPRLLHESAQVLERELREHGRDEQVRSKLAAGFPRQMLHDIVLLLAPSGTGFIEEVTSRPELFRQAARLQRESDGGIRRRLWEFTLGFLLAEKSSEFNRKSYLGSVLRQMAAHHNLQHRDLLRSLRSVLRKAETPSSFRREMLDLLTLLELESYGEREPFQRRSAGEGVGRETHRLAARLKSAFLTGEAGVIARDWQKLVTRHRRLLVETLREPGLQAEYARKMAEGFPPRMLAELVGILEPAEREFVEETARPELFAVAAGAPLASPDRLRSQLWEFTLVYLLAERGSEFNRKSYLGSLLGKVAARYNVEYRQLLQSLRQVLVAAETPTPLRREMLLLLQELDAGAALEESGAHASEGEAAAGGLGRLDRLQEALRKRDAAAAAALWSELLGASAPEVRAVLRGTATMGLLDAAVASLPEELLNKLVNLLAPADAVFIGRLAQRPELLVVTAAAANDIEASWISRQMWEFTLAFLVVDRGSAFNRKSYLETLLREMAARQNLEAHQLRLAFLHRVQALDLADPLKIMLAHFLDDDSLLGAQISEETAISDRRPPRLRKAETAVPLGSETPPEASSPSTGPADAQERPAATLRTRLLGDGPVPVIPPDLYRILLEMLEYRPEELLQILLELQAGQLSWTELATLQARERELLELMFLSLSEEESGWLDWPASGREPREDAVPADLVTRWRERLRLLLGRNANLQLASFLSLGEAGGVEEEASCVPAAAQFSGPAVDGEAEQQQRQRLLRRETARDYDQEIYIANAGLVLAAPYLPQLFRMLELTAEGAFTDRQAAEKGVQLLQYLVDATTDLAEHQLVLYKILCGLDISLPVARDTLITQREVEVLDSLLDGVIRNWEAIGSTSPAAFRESFLQREGRLQLRDEKWQLLVESRAYDLLLSRLPWSFSIVKYPWMPFPVHVEWHEGL